MRVTVQDKEFSRLRPLLESHISLHDYNLVCDYIRGAHDDFDAVKATGVDIALLEADVNDLVRVHLYEAGQPSKRARERVKIAEEE